MSIEKKNPPQIFGEINMTWKDEIKKDRRTEKNH